jgi:peptidoglycan-associated lipoprotein
MNNRASPGLHLVSRIGFPVLFALAVSACNNAAQQSTVLPAQAAPLARPANLTEPYSPSAMEALSRGLAAVTPPGAALKDIYYEFDSIDLAADAQEVLKHNAEWLKANPAARVEIEGHCDDLGSSDYNLVLGAKRAETAKNFLVNEGIDADRLVTISYGKEAPACYEETEECRVKNRRARFVIFTELSTS